MPWSNQGGGGPWGGGSGSGGGGGGAGGGGQGPWGGGPGGPQQPNLEELVRKSQERLKSVMPGGFGSGKSIAIIVILAVLAWSATGIYRVEPAQKGVELVFGKYSETTDPGLHYNFPVPIGSVFTPEVTSVNRVEVGFRSAGANRGQARNVLEESQMLTGDENIIDTQLVVFWVIKDPRLFLFNVRNPGPTVKDAAEGAMREIIGKTDFEFARTTGRGAIEADAKILIQQMLDDYGAGILVRQVELQKVDPPSAVIDAFRDVQAARADKERAINEATAYRNEVTQRAEGQAAQITAAAEAYKEEKVNRAAGESQRFIAVYNQYIQDKDVTKRRLYLETMEEVLEGMDKVLLDDTQGGSGVVPYLPLDTLKQRSEKTGDEQ